jgi:hypothetical protein
VLRVLVGCLCHKAKEGHGVHVYEADSGKFPAKSKTARACMHNHSLSHNVLPYRKRNSTNFQKRSSWFRNWATRPEKKKKKGRKVGRSCDGCKASMVMSVLYMIYLSKLDSVRQPHVHPLEDVPS